MIRGDNCYETFDVSIASGVGSLCSISLVCRLSICEANYHCERVTADNFDYTRYTNENPDLLVAYGYDKNKLFQHYRNTGKSEGRMAHTLLYKPERRARYSITGEMSLIILMQSVMRMTIPT